jgi:translation elongation factor EF-Tu-like GTPase
MTLGLDEVEPEPSRLEFRVTAVFTITGRGLVAAGVTERGSVRTGDRVAVVHGSRRIAAVCRGVEMIRTNGTVDPRTIGLLLPDLTKDYVSEGDVIVGI